MSVSGAHGGRGKASDVFSRITLQGLSRRTGRDVNIYDSGFDPNPKSIMSAQQYALHKQNILFCYIHLFQQMTKPCCNLFFLVISLDGYKHKRMICDPLDFVRSIVTISHF